MQRLVSRLLMCKVKTIFWFAVKALNSFQIKIYTCANCDYSAEQSTARPTDRKILIVLFHR